uniref:Uncharacterized protein n=1 Tax=Chromera velia CCMP2878 TaxID=1169474 RepID=A0A0G4HJP6_9ALVE|eukprot:Cvel_28335.t1-p1 / transcript=Cvel_28335.t1 / gene=Cvel_28335 / organism=Chromera_velia_CCMP2878 / gene_product=hypothetical protein / transcript_product=hypothetical protein / location=Cvel_scaffold3687:2842-3580(-) / protein_length=66 / sequence_SO=supercontig / SO=protein_coding / is_pseudo=false
MFEVPVYEWFGAFHFDPTGTELVNVFDVMKAVELHLPSAGKALTPIEDQFQEFRDLLQESIARGEP